MTEVVAALFWREGRFFICQRPGHKARAHLWEFVGGKVEPGETGPEALVRECREELGISVAVGDVFQEVIHTYPDLTIRLTVYLADMGDAVPQALEHEALAWITPDEIDNYPFCPADMDILVAIRRQAETGT